jgi:hypothetical protein
MDVRIGDETEGAAGEHLGLLADSAPFFEAPSPI